MKRILKFIGCLTLVFAGAGSVQAETVNQDQLVAAINAIPENGEGTINLAEGTFTLYGVSGASVSGKTIHFVGSGRANTTWVIGGPDNNTGGEPNAEGSFSYANRISFEKLTIKTKNKFGYQGFTHVLGGISVTDCTIDGVLCYWGETESLFQSCTFQGSGSDYSLWVYGCMKMTFDTCIFNVAGKTIHPYIEGSHVDPYEINVKDCTVNSTKANKAMVNIKDANAVYHVNFTGNNQVNGLAADAKTGSALFQVEGSQCVVTINGKTVWEAGQPVAAPAVEVEVPAVDDAKGITQEVVNEIVANTDVANVENTGIDEALKGGDLEGEEATIKVQLQEVTKATVGEKEVTTLKFEVAPYVGETKIEGDEGNAKLNGKPVAFRLPLLKEKFVEYAKISHEGDPDRFVLVKKGANGEPYVDVALTHFSTVLASAATEDEMVPEGAVKIQDGLWGANGKTSMTEAEIVYIVGATGLKAFRDWANGGTGTEGTVFGSGKTFILVADVDLQGSDENLWTPAGKHDTNMFAGTFDGNGKSIQNLYAKCSYSGLFTEITEGGCIKNLTIASGKIVVDAANKGAGSVVGYMTGGRIENVTNYAEVAAIGTYGRVGGIVGVQGDDHGIGVISNCVNYGKVWQESGLTSAGSGGHLGGIVGQCMYKLKVFSCKNYGDITADLATINVGGIIGNAKCDQNSDFPEEVFTLENCVNYAMVTTAGGGNIGGVICNFKNGAGGHGTPTKVGATFGNCANYGELVGSPSSTGAKAGFVEMQWGASKVKLTGPVSVRKGQSFSNHELASAVWDPRPVAMCPGVAKDINGNDIDVDTYYLSIADAIAAAKAGDMVKLVAASSENFTLKVGVTFDASKAAYTGTISAPEGYFVKEVSTKVYECQPLAAKVGDKSFSTLAAALAAVNDGETLTMFADAADIGTVSLKGIVFDGNGHKITGASAFYCGADKATVIKNVVFENIHNNSPVSADNIQRYGLPEGSIGTQSAIYGEEFKTGSITITGCAFDNIDWDAIQIVPAMSGVTGTVTIRDNVFRHTGVLPQLRYVHIQYAGYWKPTLVVTATDNQMYDCEKNIAAFCVAGFAKGEGSDYSGNYISDVSKIDCSDSQSIKIVDFYPMRSEATVDVDDLDPRAVFDLKPITTADELVAAINACATAKPELYFRGDLTATSPVVFENPNITKIWWYGVATSGTAGFTFRAPSLKTGVPLYLLNDAKIVLDGAFVADGKCEIASGTYSAESFSGSFEISGGKFNKDISALVEPRIGHAVDNGDGTWSVEAYTDQTALEDGKPFKVTGPHYYASMEEAIKESRIFDVIGDAFDDADFGTVSPQITLKNMAAFAGSLKSQNQIKINNSKYTEPKAINFTSVTCPVFTYGSSQSWLGEVKIGGGEISRMEIDSTYTSTTLSGDLKVDEILIATYWYDNKQQKAALTITGGTYGKIKFRANASSEPVGSLPNDAVDLKITGGTFGFNPTPYVPTENYRVIQNGENWTVAEKQTEVVVDKAKVEDESGNPIEGEAATQAEAIKTDVSSTMTSSAVVDFTGTGIKAAATSEDGTMAPALVAAFGKSGDEKDALAASQSNFEWLSNSLDKVVCKVEGGNASLQRLEYTVKPYAKVIYTVGTEEKTEETVIPNSVFAGNPITFRLAVIWDVGDQVKVFRDGSNFGISTVKADEKDVSKHFVEIKSDHFSVFTLERTTASTVCEVGGQAFESVSEAIAASAESPTAVIKLKAPCGETGLQLKWGQEIDVNGYEFTGSITPVAEPGSDFTADKYEQVKTPAGRVFSAPKQVVVPLDASEDSATIKVRIAGKTADELKAVQTTSGRALWQDLAMGSTEKLIPQVLRSAIGSKTITIRGTISDEAVEAAAKQRDGVSVKYQLKKRVGNGDFLEYGSVQDIPVFTVEASQLETRTSWKIETIFDEEY